MRMVQAWNTKGVEGVHRFLARAYRLATGELSDAQPNREQLRLLHTTIKRVSLPPGSKVLLERISVHCAACNIKITAAPCSPQSASLEISIQPGSVIQTPHGHRVLLCPH